MKICFRPSHDFYGEPQDVLQFYSETMSIDLFVHLRGAEFISNPALDCCNLLISTITLAVHISRLTLLRLASFVPAVISISFPHRDLATLLSSSSSSPISALMG